MNDLQSKSMNKINNNDTLNKTLKFKHIVRRSIKKKSAVKAASSLKIDPNNPDIKNVFYVKTSPFQARQNLNKKEDIFGIVYEESGARFRANLHTLPHNTIIRFYYRLDHNGNPHSMSCRKWNKEKNRIDRYD